MCNNIAPALLQSTRRERQQAQTEHAVAASPVDHQERVKSPGEAEMHSPLLGTHTLSLSPQRGTPEVGAEMEDGDSHFRNRAMSYQSPTMESPRYNASRRDAFEPYPPVLNSWQSNDSIDPNADAPERVDVSSTSTAVYGPQPPTSHDEHLRPPSYLQTSPITSSHPQQATRFSFDQQDATEEVESHSARDAFEPPSAFPRGQWHPRSTYGRAGFYAWDRTAYNGHRHGWDPRFRHYHHHYQQHYYHYGAHEPQAHDSGMTQLNPYAYPAYHHAILPPPEQENDEYHEWTPLPYAPSQTDNVTGAAPYYPFPPPPPPHHQGYDESGRPIFAGHDQVYSGRYDAMSYPRAAHGQALDTSSVSARGAEPCQAKAKNSRTDKSNVTKDSNKPKRPLSAYNLFFKEERQRMIEELEKSQSGKRKERETTDDCKQPGKKKKKLTGIGFKPMAQSIGAKWKALDKDSLTVYEEMAAEDLKRYRREMKEYNANNRKEADEASVVTETVDHD